MDDVSDSEEDSVSGSDEASSVDDEAQPSCSGSSELVTQGSQQKEDTNSSSSSCSGGSPAQVTDSPAMNGRVEEDMETHTNSANRIGKFLNNLKCIGYLTVQRYIIML